MISSVQIGFQRVLFQQHREKNMFACTYQTPVGEITLAEENGALKRLCFGHLPKLPAGTEVKETPLILKARRQLDEYFAGQRHRFDLPLQPEGTSFQQKVWSALQSIPYGKTASYKDIAVKIGNPRACRAVGMANNKNPLAIVIPCHRVVGSDGKLVGYGGGLGIKEYLLNLELKAGA